MIAIDVRGSSIFGNYEQTVHKRNLVRINVNANDLTLNRSSKYSFILI